jgi:hypothetical protein
VVGLGRAEVLAAGGAAAVQDGMTGSTNASMAPGLDGGVVEEHGALYVALGG